MSVNSMNEMRTERSLRKASFINQSFFKTNIKLNTISCIFSTI